MKYFKKQFRRLRHRYNSMSVADQKEFKQTIAECIGCTLMLAAVITIMVLSILLEKN